MQNDPFHNNMYSIQLDYSVALCKHHINVAAGSCGINFNHFIYCWVA